MNSSAVPGSAAAARSRQACTSASDADSSPGITVASTTRRPSHVLSRVTLAATVS